MMALPAINKTGEPFVVRGINSVSSRVLGMDDRQELYPDREWIRDLLRERSKLNARRELIEKLLRPVHIKVQRDYGNMPAAKYEKAIESLQADYDKAVAAADGFKPSEASPAAQAVSA